VLVRLTLIDDQGREWLVRDGVVQERKFIPLAIGDHQARFRVFDLKEPRIRKVYLFPKDLMHAVNGPTLERQFLEATTVERGEREP
jgi:hypothetical protein